MTEMDDSGRGLHLVVLSNFFIDHTVQLYLTIWYNKQCAVNIQLTENLKEQFPKNMWCLYIHAGLMTGWFFGAGVCE